LKIIVIAIDTSMERLKIARHNAMQYGVADRIEFICADYVEFVQSWVRRKESQRASQQTGEGEAVVGLGEEVDVIFLSPPWGGTDYLANPEADTTVDPEASFAIPNHLPTFPLHTLKPLPAKELYDLSRKMTPNIAYYLPRNSDPNEIASWADDLPPSASNFLGDAPTKEWVEVEEEWMGYSEHDPFADSKNQRGRRSIGTKGADGKLKAITAYFGGLAGPTEDE
jgi:trimethylguanosine synthase